ncbi:hypothetical protein [Robertmurraya andreesenii]|uniref:Uncharacterized protein n=1 Tax=Anoxybacillus andreesenii TaxID=1325932 RepID=A0ABT9V850_9BACL|nr:hypothetical protein [Robertmurraya andreesenii]MDQ0157132.1 hypothetical protein [Robertmurraya andreesenii]
MDKKKFSIFTYCYIVLVVIVFIIYAFQVADENWKVQLDGQRGNLMIFAGLLLIGMILASIEFAGINQKGNKVTKSTIYGGLSIAAFFLVWRLMMAIV